MKQRIQKVLAAAGVESRRHVEEMVRQGRVSVNGEVVLQLPVMVDPAVDKIEIDGEPVRLKLKESGAPKELVYVLLNKPKDVYSTNVAQGEQVRAIDLLPEDFPHRVYPVGRLDADSKGLLLLTNDGDLAQKLSHPSHEVKKIYQVTLDKALTKADFEKVLAGVELEDGVAKVDSLAYLENKNEVGLEIHSGRNRIVRRIFESLGYEVDKLDRVMYAGLTKKNISRGQWRILTDREVVLLKHFKN